MSAHAAAVKGGRPASICTRSGACVARHEQLIAFTAAGASKVALSAMVRSRTIFYDSYSASSLRLHAQQSKDAKRRLVLARRAPANVSTACRREHLADPAAWRRQHARGRPPVQPHFARLVLDRGRLGGHALRHPPRRSQFGVLPRQPVRLVRAGARRPELAGVRLAGPAAAGECRLHALRQQPAPQEHARATRYKNALTSTAGSGKPKRLRLSTRPTDAAFQAWTTLGTLLRTHAGGNYAAVTGDASLAYQALDTSRNLDAAAEQCRAQRGGGQGQRPDLVYDWATSATPASGS
jgi:hypothetical protein